MSSGSCSGASSRSISRARATRACGRRARRYRASRHIPARYLKIDTEFGRDLTTSQTDRQLVESIIHVAHSLNKSTIAEGIEDAETLAALKAMGAGYGQGFHLGKPTRLSPRTAFERGLQGSKTPLFRRSPTKPDRQPSACLDRGYPVEQEIATIEAVKQALGTCPPA